MAVYSYYYGASPEQGIGIRAQSPELGRLPLASEMQELASLHALESSEHSGEMMAYLLEKEGYSILGVSYTESPKASGYNRSAPCSLQYIAPAAELEKASAELSRIVNFVSFKKPGTTAPAPLRWWPLNESGYYFHNSPAVLAPLVDGLVRAAMPGKNDVLLIGLPKGKNSEYAYARYTIAELLACIPAALRANVRFFTGLPVAEGISDPAAGFDNAVKYGANVVFCPNEYFTRIMSYRTCIGVDMEKPGRSAGAFANYISQAPDISDALNAADSCLSGAMTYDGLNAAARQAAEGKIPTIDEIRQELDGSRRYARQLEQQIDAGNRAYSQLQDENDRQNSEIRRLQGEIRQLQSEPRQYARQEYEYSRPASTGRNAVPAGRENKGGALRKILAGILALVLLAGGAAGGYFFAKSRNGGEPAKQEEQKDARETAVTPTPEPTPEETAETPAPEPTPEETAETPAPEPTPEETEKTQTPEPTPEETEKTQTPEPTPEPTPEKTEETQTPADDAEQDPAQTGETETEEPGEGEEKILTEETLAEMFPNLAGYKDVLRKGSPEEAVIRDLQQRLLDLGYDIQADKPDGKFGKHTTEAVKAFQKKNKIGSTANPTGLVDETTRKKLLSPDAVRGDED